MQRMTKVCQVVSMCNNQIENFDYHIDVWVRTFFFEGVYNLGFPWCMTKALQNEKNVHKSYNSPKFS